MIFLYALQFFLNITNWLSTILPTATTLPWGIDANLINGIGYLRFVITYFPPLETLLTAFLIYIGFILLLKVIQLIPIIRNIIN